MEIISIKNGFIIADSQSPQDWVYCRTPSELHQELEFTLGVEPKKSKPDISGVRQFDDED